MKLFIVALAFLTFSCSSHPQPQTFSDQAVIFAKRAWKSERLHFEGVIDGEPGRAALLFCSDKHVGLDEARRMVVATAHHFLKRGVDGLDENNLILGIQFKEEGRFMRDHYIAEATLRRGKIHYYRFNGARKEVYQEAYDEAFAKAFGTMCPEGFRPYSAVWE